ncbi:MAG: AAA family ATPase [Bacteroidaceae bacterium]|nr:AAA family ATPase [Bacteroidaceae bacterium]
MIEEITLRNWKSYKNSKLYIEPLTFIIGFNASGKSNVLDALHFLSELAKGATIDDVGSDIRGGKDWIISRDEARCGIDVKIHNNDTDYLYTIEFSKIDEKLVITKECLSTNLKDLLLTDENKVLPNKMLLSMTSYTAKQGRRRTLQVLKDKSALFQLASAGLLKEVTDGINIVLNSFKNIFMLNPIAPLMRNYTPLQKELKEDASNIAGVIAAIEESEKSRLQKKIADFVRPLPERDIVRVWTETVGMFGKDAMLYCEESWIEGKTQKLDARGMSDGTLRFIAIVTALLTLPEKTLLLIEEVDNGLHPSRSKELIKALEEIGEERNIDVLCTTHNPYLIDSLGTDMIPCITYVKRNEQTGSSELKTLDENENLVNLMASGSIGLSMVNGRI